MTWEALCDVQSNTVTTILGLIKFINANPQPGSFSQGNALTVRRAGTAVFAAASRTPSATLLVMRRLLLNSNAGVTTAEGLLRGIHKLTITPSVEGNTPDDVMLLVQRKLIATSSIISQIPLLILVITGNAWAIGSVRMRFRMRSS